MRYNFSPEAIRITARVLNSSDSFAGLRLIYAETQNGPSFMVCTDGLPLTKNYLRRISDSEIELVTEMLSGAIQVDRDV